MGRGLMSFTPDHGMRSGDLNSIEGILGYLDAALGVEEVSDQARTFPVMKVGLRRVAVLQAAVEDVTVPASHEGTTTLHLAASKGLAMFAKQVSLWSRPLPSLRS